MISIFSPPQNCRTIGVGSQNHGGVWSWPSACFPPCQCGVCSSKPATELHVGRLYACVHGLHAAASNALGHAGQQAGAMMLAASGRAKGRVGSMHAAGGGWGRRSRRGRAEVQGGLACGRRRLGVLGFRENSPPLRSPTWAQSFDPCLFSFLTLSCPLILFYFLWSLF